MVQPLVIQDYTRLILILPVFIVGVNNDQSYFGGLSYRKNSLWYAGWFDGEVDITSNESTRNTLNVSGSVANPQAIARFTNNYATASDAYGVYSYSRPVDYYGYGGYFEGGWYGIKGVVNPTGSNTYHGVQGNVSGGSGWNYGLEGYAWGSGTNYGLYASASGGTTNWAGYFNGNVAFDVGTYDVIVDYSAGEPTVRPSLGNWGYVGTSGNYWYKMYANTYYGNNTTIQLFDTYDDIALLNAIEGDTVWDPILKHHIMIIKPETMPRCVTNYREIASGETKNEFIDLQNMDGLLIGAFRQLYRETKTHDKRLEARMDIIAQASGINFNNNNKVTIKISDFGNSKMEGNEMWVPFSEDFASKLGKSIPSVTVTPNCPSIVLCITEKNNKGFKVVGVSGNGGFSFDWIAMAKVNVNLFNSDIDHIDNVFYRKSFEVPLGNYEVIDHSIEKQNEINQKNNDPTEMTNSEKEAFEKQKEQNAEQARKKMLEESNANYQKYLEEKKNVKKSDEHQNSSMQNEDKSNEKKEIREEIEEKIENK
ncbi:MAG: hypothetical protein HY738_06315 [Bacteroidia bacterium]|nr:hypothetical protein [Bacteroidia bacterium]